MRVVRGKYTMLRINRFNNRNVAVRNRFTERRTQTVGEQYIGELLSIVNHIDQGVLQHYVSYHRLSGANDWYLNDDYHRVQRVPYHPYNSLTETVNLVVYKNF